MPGFREACRSGKFLVTAEIGPPKGTDVSAMVERIDSLVPVVDAINSTDNQSSVMRLSSLAASHEVLRRGGDPILQMTCRDRNRLALQSDLLAAHSLGMRNVLCLTGDHPSVGDHKEAKPVFDFESVQLIQCIRGLNEGVDWAGHQLDGATDFFIGGVVTPDADPIEPQLGKFRKKVEAGANFFQTQAVYDMEGLERFMEQARAVPGAERVKILAGLLVLTSVGMAKYMNEFVPGIKVPEYLLQELAAVSKEQALRKGMDICARQIRYCLDHRVCDGVHVMSASRDNVIPEILAMAGLS